MTSLFHPLIEQWFSGRFAAPTEAQRLGWPEIVAGRHTLIAAPTGSGKTLAAFLACIDRLARQGLAGELVDETQVVYVSPLKALSNDVQRNLQRPLEEINQQAVAMGLTLPPIRALVRTGDTPSSERQKMTRRAPHILVTTPESLYLLLTAAKGRETLRTVRTVIVDEIHALARDKRGSHLSLSLERLEALTAAPLVRIGLSATQRPLDEMARFLVGTRRVGPDGQPDCRIIDAGHVRDLDLGIEVPVSPLSAVCSHETWDEVYQRLCELIQSHRSTLVFVNTRRMAERVAHRLTEALGEDFVASHHGSLSKDIRLSAEQRLANGQLRAIVATASLELGIDVGHIDLVCQLGSPRAIATFLQRVGRSGHFLGGLPKGRLFALTRDELLESLALVRAVRERRLDQIEIPRLPRDILAQQIVAATAAEEWSEEALFELCRGAWPFSDLTRAEFDAIVQMLSEGYARTHRRGAWLHRDGVNKRLKARRGARIAALTSGGAIPELADYRVVTADEGTFVGTVNEDFAIESLAGDVFQLGNTAWRICYVRGGQVVVRDAQGAPATIPFWLGEAPGRTIELSAEVSRLREDLAARSAATTRHEDLSRSERTTMEDLAVRSAPIHRGEGQENQDRMNAVTTNDAAGWLVRELGTGESAARQAAEYVAAQVEAVGFVPTQRKIMFERFFDESGGMQLVIHAPLGARINRAWGLAMRKRFCRSFDFELQASADDNGVVLSLGPQHSFAIEHMFRMLNSGNAEHTLTQALLAAPMFQVRWRWNATRSLAILRQNGGKKVPPPLQRFRADDLLTAVFPLQTACLENRPEDIPIPDHPLVTQTIYDCLHEAMDLPRWLALIADIEAGRLELIGRDTREPSPFSYEILNANPYAFLDDAPLEERRARAVATRRTLSPGDLGNLAWLDPAAIQQVRADAWPLVRDSDELHDALLMLGGLPASEGAAWAQFFQELLAAGRATTLKRPAGPALWVAAERLTLIQAALPDATPDPILVLPPELAQEQISIAGKGALVRGRLEVTGPVTAAQVAGDLGLDEGAVEAALEALEGEGCVLRGQFTEKCGMTASGGQRVEGPGPETPALDSLSTNGAPSSELSAPSFSSPSAPHSALRTPHSEWCDRRLLARIHRLTLDRARKSVEAAEPADFLRFLAAHQHLTEATRLSGQAAVLEAIGQMQGFEAPAGAWERDLLPGRVRDYDPAWLDDLALSGEVTWGRLRPPAKAEDEPPSGSGLSRVVPIALVTRADLAWLLPPDRGRPEEHARSNARLVYQALCDEGALFLPDLLAITGLLGAQLEDALSELAALGLVTADGFATIRLLVSPDRRRAADARRRRDRHKKGVRNLFREASYGASRRKVPDTFSGGRWSRFPGRVSPVDLAERAERWARQLLRRYGVLFRDLLARESAAPVWRELAAVCRRWEAQGQIRGGRFVKSVAGEQFALPEAVTELRRLRELGPSGEWVALSACDPLNLAGIITPGPRLPAVPSNSFALRDGQIVATQQAGEVTFLTEIPSGEADGIARALIQSAIVRQERTAELAAAVGGGALHCGGPSATMTG